MITADQTKRRRLQEFQKHESVAKENWKEFATLEAEVQEADMNAFIFPTCCEAARKHPSVFVRVNIYDGDS